MTGRDDLVERLLHRDSAAHMDGSANWVVDAHPDDPSRPGQIVVQIPWQANGLLIEAAAELDALTAERDRLREAIRAHRDAVKCCDKSATTQVEDRSSHDGILWGFVDGPEVPQ